VFLLKPFKIIFEHRYIIKSTTLSDIRTKYAGSLLGLFWLLLYPLLLLAAYSVVYIFIFSVRFGTMSSLEYVLLIFSGLIPFLGYNEALAASIPSVSANSALVKNTLFPIDVLPIKAVFVSQCTQAVGMLILLLALLITGKLTHFAFLLIPVWFFQVLLSIGVGWFLSALNIFFKDLQNIVTLISIFLMMVSPIAYTVDMIPTALQPFLKLNILYYFIVSYQDCLVIGYFPRDNVLLYLIVISLVMFTGGYWFFNKMKIIFSDNL